MDELVRTLMIEYFPKGETILSPKGPSTQFLYIIRSGGVRFLMSEKEGKEGDRIYDYRDEGDFFWADFSFERGTLSFHDCGRGRYPLLPRQEGGFQETYREYPDVFLYFTSGPSKGFKQFDTGSPPMDPSVRGGAGAQQVLFACRVKDVMHTNVLTCPSEETIVGVARRMTERGVGSMIVVDDIGVPVGILTDGDLRSKVLASGKLITLPVLGVMNRPVQCVRPDAFCFEAILSMTTNRIKYLPVMDGMKLVGIISEHDLMVSQGNNPVAVIKGIQQATTIEQVVLIRKNIDLAMNVILEHGGMAKDICELITTLNDHLTRKIVALAEEAMGREGYGLPPVPYAWLALGSEGRREQTLRTTRTMRSFLQIIRPVGKRKLEVIFSTWLKRWFQGWSSAGFPDAKAGSWPSIPSGVSPFTYGKILQALDPRCRLPPPGSFGHLRLFRLPRHLWSI